MLAHQDCYLFIKLEKVRLEKQILSEWSVLVLELDEVFGSLEDRWIVRLLLQNQVVSPLAVASSDIPHIFDHVLSLVSEELL